ncbi:MAG: hypothetical protein L3J35_11500 [Bacteroidales bacterium]|nr:hypothetical protein [Bacteroidales bacterium]
MQAGLSTKNAPSPSIVLPHYAIGAIFFIIASVLMYFASGDLANSYIGPKVLSMTHIVILGWITIIIFGALYQLIPVVMEVKLFSETLAHISLYTLVPGTVLLAYSFWNSYIVETLYMQAGGTLIFISIILFLVNAFMTALKTKQKTIENVFIVTSALWLTITVIFGILITMNTALQFIPKSNIELLKIHVHIGIVGWFMLLVIGVASTLLPMFFIAHKLNRKFLKLSYYFINIGLIALIVALYIDINSWTKIISGLILLTGIIFFVKYNFDAYKKRLRKKLDIGMKLSVFAFVLLFLTLIFGVLSVINLDDLKNYNMSFNTAYGVSLLLGFLTSLILGQMYKTLPFIVWLKLYQDKVGKFKIPMPAHIYSERVANWHYYTFLIAFFTLLIGIFAKESIIIQVSSGAFLITASLYSYNTFKILFHKEKLEPLDY